MIVETTKLMTQLSLNSLSKENSAWELIGAIPLNFFIISVDNVIELKLIKFVAHYIYNYLPEVRVQKPL